MVHWRSRRHVFMRLSKKFQCDFRVCDSSHKIVVYDICWMRLGFFCEKFIGFDLNINECAEFNTYTGKASVTLLLESKMIIPSIDSTNWKIDIDMVNKYLKPKLERTVNRTYSSLNITENIRFYEIMWTWKNISNTVYIPSIRSIQPWDTELLTGLFEIVQNMGSFVLPDDVWGSGYSSRIESVVYELEQF